MKFSKNSWHSWLYRSFYLKQAPDNLCQYARGLFLAIILFPFNWLFHVANYIECKNNWDVWRATINGKAGVFCQFFGFIIMYGILPVKHFSFGISLLFFSGFLSFIFYMFIVTIGFIVLFSEKYKGKFTRKNISNKIKHNIFTEFIKAKYNRYCPKINWID